MCNRHEADSNTASRDRVISHSAGATNDSAQQRGGLKHANHLAILVNVNVEKGGARGQTGHGRHRANLQSEQYKTTNAHLVKTNSAENKSALAPPPTSNERN
jgi:hypothetical protein